MNRRHLWATVAALIVALGPRSAAALDVPSINGHMTDPTHALSENDKTAVEDKLSKIQEDTRVDVAGWIVDAPEDTLEASGNEAYRRWKIGTDWDNGLFFMIPRSGAVRIIQNRLRPELDASEVSRITSVDDPHAPMMQRIQRMADTAGGMLRTKTLRARPRGVTDPARGRRYAAGALVVLLVAALMSFRRRAQPIS